MQISILASRSGPTHFMIIKRKDGYYVISEKTHKNLGGPYALRAEAVKRLRQVEFFKHKGHTA